VLHAGEAKSNKGCLPNFYLLDWAVVNPSYVSIIILFSRKATITYP